MFVCVEAYDRHDSEKFVGEVPNELIAQALAAYAAAIFDGEDLS